MHSFSTLSSSAQPAGLHGDLLPEVQMRTGCRELQLRRGTAGRKTCTVEEGSAQVTPPGARTNEDQGHARQGSTGPPDHESAAAGEHLPTGRAATVPAWAPRAWYPVHQTSRRSATRRRSSSRPSTSDPHPWLLVSSTLPGSESTPSECSGRSSGTASQRQRLTRLSTATHR